MKKSILLLIIFETTFTNKIFSQLPGSLDPAFGINGIVTTAVGNYIDGGYSVAIQQDGKILVAGLSDNGLMSQFALVRYNSDGLPDSTFGINGNVITPIGGTSQYGYGAKSLVIQPDDKIVTAGISIVNSVEEFTLVRYDTDGSPDSTFGLNGIVTTYMGSWSGIFSIALQPDGKIVAAGYAYPGAIRFAVARYNSDGTLDDTFGDGGKVITAFGIGDVEAFSLALQPDGKIVAAGYADGAFSSEFALVRYNSNGNLDSTFGIDGIVTTEGGQAYSVVIQEDGKIVIGGASGAELVALRYNTDGSPDLLFGTGGIALNPIGNNAQCTSMVVQTDGKILLAGTSYESDTSKLALLRYDTAGFPDSTFGTNGIITTAIGLYSYANGAALQQDGKGVLAGGADNYFAVARYNTATPTAVESFLNKDLLLVFPNPASDKITASFSSNQSGVVQITNTLGQIIFSEKINTAKEEIDVSVFPTGMYLLTLTTSSKKFESEFLKQ